MKRPTKQLRARALDTQALAAATGGRGIRYGYVNCLNCGNTDPEGTTRCSQCGVYFSGSGGGIGSLY